MLLPYRTDAPVYHFPWATLGIIGACILIQLGLGDSEALDAFVLHFGTINPTEWILSAFAHGGWMHVLGNMVFLWVFGLVVEGKIGWWRFLALYGAIAAASGLVEQVIMLWADHGGALGASGVIFGLIAIAMVWAPENEIDCIFIFGFGRQFEIPIKAFAGLYLLLQVFDLILAGGRMSTPLLHLIGAAAGLPMGIYMLRRGWVDCEGWDWFSRRAHAGRGSAPPRPAPADPAAAAASAEQEAEVLAAHHDTFAELVAAGSLDAALSLWHGHGARLGIPIPLREHLVAALITRDRHADARPFIAGILAEDPGHPGMSLVEAQLLLHEQRPAKARGVLAATAGRLDTDRQRELHARLLARAAELEAAGVLEMSD